MGTVYDEAALDGVHETVRRFGLNLHMDGARFANAAATLGIALSTANSDWAFAKGWLRLEMSDGDNS